MNEGGAIVSKKRRKAMDHTKLAKMEKYWILYDIGNSAFILLVSTIIPIHFGLLAENAGVPEVDYLGLPSKRQSRKMRENSS